MNKLREMKIKFWVVPVLLLGGCLAAFGLLAPGLGFYWDDWTQILVSRLYDLSTYWEYFSYDRPTSAWTHILLVPLLGGSPLRWQIFTMLLRWLTAWGMWWTFCGLWPGFKRQVTLAALLFLVYPSFTQQPHAVSYHQHFLQYALFFISMGAMVQAQRRRGAFWVFTALSLTAQILSLSITEFFIGVEFLLRLMMLWSLVNEQAWKEKRKGIWTARLLDTLRIWWPYMLVAVGYTVWRLFIVTFPEGEPHSPALLYLLFSQPLLALKSLAQVIPLDILDILVNSWAPVLDLQLENASQPVVAVSWVVSLVLVGGLVISLWRLEDNENPDGSDEYGEAEAARNRWMRQASLVGAVVVLAGPSPLWIMGEKMVSPVVPDFHIDRFSLAAMFGASLLFTVLIEWGMKDWRRKVVFMSLLVGLAAGFHIRTGNDYRWVWTRQLRFYWQLSWRAPHIEAPTALVAEEIFLQNQELASTSSALNLLYPQERYPEQLGYWLYRLRRRFEKGLPEGNQMSFNTTHRNLSFVGSTPDSLLIQYDPNVASCLWVLDPVYSAGNPDLPDLTAQALPISNLERISPDPRWEDGPPADLFGEEPAHDWCYLFQKADLARQMGDWEWAVEIADSARNEGYAPTQYPANSPYEWMPMIEGYLHQERWDAAHELTLASYEYMPRYGPMLCGLWERALVDILASDDGNAAHAAVSSHLGCSP